jgi:hypothetical protein
MAGAIVAWAGEASQIGSSRGVFACGALGASRTRLTNVRCQMP